MRIHPILRSRRGFRQRIPPVGSRRDGCECMQSVSPPCVIAAEIQKRLKICSKVLAGATWGTHQAAESGAVKPNLSCPNPLLGRRLLHLAHAGRYCMVCSARPKQPKRGHFEPFLTLGLVEIPDHENSLAVGKFPIELACMTLCGRTRTVRIAIPIACSVWYVTRPNYRPF